MMNTFTSKSQTRLVDTAKREEEPIDFLKFGKIDSYSFEYLLHGSLG